MNRNDNNVQKDIEILAEFIHLYCKDAHHGIKKTPPTARGAVGGYIRNLHFPYCDDCRGLLLHASSKRLVCPYDPKPSCKKCETHCYGPGYREKVREVMRYSGMRLIMRGNFRLIRKYFF